MKVLYVIKDKPMSPDMILLYNYIFRPFQLFSERQCATNSVIWPGVAVNKANTLHFPNLLFNDLERSISIIRYQLC